MDDATIKMMKMLDACEDVENAAASIYHFYADYFRSDVKVAKTWRMTALEEENHARQVCMAKKMLKSISWVSIDAWRQVFSIQKHIHALSDWVRKNPPTLEEALQTSIVLEEKMDHLHMMNSVMMVEKSGNAMFVAMMKEDQDHLLKLREMLTDILSSRAGAGTCLCADAFA
jgi:rubrerythrin